MRKKVAGPLAVALAALVIASCAELPIAPTEPAGASSARLAPGTADLA